MGLWTLAIFGVVVLGVLMGLRGLGRPVPAAIGLVFFVLPVLFCLPGFLPGRTMLPIDHVRLYVPWSTPASVAPRNPNLNDAVTQFAPWTAAVRRAWAEGSLPLRNAWNGCGTPLAANGNSAAFSPITFLAMLLPLAHAFTLGAALKLFLSSCGMWLWLREIEVSPPAALFGAICFSFSLAITPLLLFTISSVVALWPWAVFALEWLARTETRNRAFALLTVVLAAAMLCGHPESVAIGLGGIVLMFAARRLFGERVPRAVWTRALAAAALAGGLVAFLWLPQLLAVKTSSRAVEARVYRAHYPLLRAPHGPAWRYGVLTSLYPRTFGDAIESPMIPGSAGNTVDMALGYFGIIGWAAALLILRPGSARSVQEKAAFAILLCGLAIGTGTWPFFEASLAMPLVGLVFPLRFLGWVSLAGSAVAAFELDRLRRDVGDNRPSSAWALVPPLLLGAGAALTYWRFKGDHLAAGGLASQEYALRITLAAMLLLALVFAGLVSRRLAFRHSALAMCGLAAAELWLQGARLYQWGSAAAVFPPTPLTEFLRSREGPFRVAGEGSALFPGTNVFAGVQDVRTHDPVERRDYVEFLDGTCGYSPAGYFKFIRDIDAPVLDFLNVRYLIRAAGAKSPGARWSPVYSASDGSIFENGNVLPRVFSPRRVRFAGGAGSCASGENLLAMFGEERSRILARRDWRDEASVCTGRAVTPEDAAGRENPMVAVTEYRESTNAVSFVAQTSAPGILVASLVNDGGWSAMDAAGHRLELFPANGPFVGLSVAPGKSRVQLRYWPRGMREGLAVSAASLVVALCLMARLMLRRRTK